MRIAVREYCRLKRLSKNLPHWCRIPPAFAVTVTAYHARQEQVWESLQRSHIREPYVIRRMVTE